MKTKAADRIKKKAKERKALIKYLDTLVSQIVILRDGKCVICGSKETLGCGHLFTRNAYSTRWDMKNCAAQCWPCNFRHEYDHYPYNAWFIKKYGEGELEALHRRFVEPHKWSTPDLQEMAEIMTKTLEKLI